jgi:hypothetical protein
MKNECPATNYIYLEMPSGSEARLSRWALTFAGYYWVFVPAEKGTVWGCWLLVFGC